MPEPELFKLPPPKDDANIDATTKAVRAIIDEEIAARIAKTERLRAARLAREAVEQPVLSTKNVRRSQVGYLNGAGDKAPASKPGSPARANSPAKKPRSPQAGESDKPD